MKGFQGWKKETAGKHRGGVPSAAPTQSIPIEMNGHGSLLSINCSGSALGKMLLGSFAYSQFFWKQCSKQMFGGCKRMRSSEGRANGVNRAMPHSSPTVFCQIQTIFLLITNQGVVMPLSTVGLPASFCLLVPRGTNHQRCPFLFQYKWYNQFL